MKSQLIRTSIIALALVAVSCSSEETMEKDEQFCKCMEAGEKLNAHSSTLLEKSPTKEDAEKMEELKAIKKKECKNYQTMGGDEMLKRKKLCEQ